MVCSWQFDGQWCITSVQLSELAGRLPWSGSVALPANAIESPTLHVIPADGDVIVAVDEQPVTSAEDVVRAVNQQRLPGDDIRLTVLRGAERLELTVTLGGRPANPPNLAC